MLGNRTILVVVPARGSSKGVKLKNIRPFRGIPLVAWTAKVVQQLPYVDRAVVSTDHPQIAAVATRAGLDVPFMRPQSISGDIISDWDVLHHALLATEKDDGKTYDIIVMLQPTSPLRRPEHVTAAVEKLVRGNFDAVWTVTRTDSKAHPLKQLVIVNDRLDYYDKRGAKIIARQQLTPVFHRNGAAYVVTRDCLINQKTIKGRNSSAVIIEEPLINIDTEFDIKLGEYIADNLKEIRF